MAEKQQKLSAKDLFLLGFEYIGEKEYENDEFADSYREYLLNIGDLNIEIRHNYKAGHSFVDEYVYVGDGYFPNMELRDLESLINILTKAIKNG